MASDKMLPVRTFMHIALGCAIGVGVLGAYYFFNTGRLTPDPGCQKMFPLTSRTLDCGNYSESVARLSALDAKLEDATALYIKEGKATRVSVFVRDLETKQLAGSNENETYAPASILKLPVLITYYKVAMLDPSILKNQIAYAAPLSVDEQDYAAPDSPLVVGQSYAVDELLRRMIVDSDNTATALLQQRIDPQLYTQVLTDLGIQIPSNTGVVDFVTAKTVSGIYRNLYNASYLNRYYSQMALDLLSKSSFAGLKATLPKSIVVAQKFGQRTLVTNDSTTTRELHDCGIVYADPDPYSICVMTQGSDYNTLLTVIQNLSDITYRGM